MARYIRTSGTENIYGVKTLVDGGKTSFVPTDDDDITNKLYVNGLMTSHTHTAAQITDFNSAVSSNSAVTANTSARHTHSNKSVIDLLSDSGGSLYYNGTAVNSNNFDQSLNTTDDVTFNNVSSTGVIKINGTQVITSQQAAISSPSGGSTIDAEARTAINDILAALRTHGLIET